LATSKHDTTLPFFEYAAIIVEAATVAATIIVEAAAVATTIIVEAAAAAAASEAAAKKKVDDILGFPIHTIRRVLFVSVKDIDGIFHC